MPTYQNVVPPISIAQGDTATVINNENPHPALPYKSAQVALTGGLRINAQRLSAEVTFAAAPGAFSFQLQTADSDTDASYSPEGAAVTALTGTNVARIELNNVVAKFARIYFSSLTNNVAVTAKLSC
jgi:hypothetical protein